MAQPGHPVVQLDPLADGFLCGEEVPVDRMRRLREQTGILRLRCFRVVAVLAQRGGFGLVGLGDVIDTGRHCLLGHSPSTGAADGEGRRGSSLRVVSLAAVGAGVSCSAARALRGQSCLCSRTGKVVGGGVSARRVAGHDDVGRVILEVDI